MEYQVHGEDISEEEFSQDQGWQSAGARRAGAKTRTADSNAPSPQPDSRRTNSGGAALKSKVLRAGKMPSLPRDDIKIVIRPRGGLNISKIGAATPRSSSRPRHDSSGRTRSRSRTPTTPKSKKKPTLSWADKAREGRESPRGDDSPRGSPHAKELDERRRANEQMRKENAHVKQEMSRLAAEMAEIRRLASSPPSAQPASAPVAMDTSEAPHRSSAPKRRAVENTEEEETGSLLLELKDAFVAAQRNILAPPTEGAILKAASAAQPSPQPKYGEKLRLAPPSNSRVIWSCHRIHEVGELLHSSAKEVADGIEYFMTEILMNSPKKGLRRNSLFILNIYCSPSYRRARADSLLKRAVSMAGYAYDTPKGRELLQTATEADLTLITDKDFPARRGNSRCRDTNPDLTFVKSVGEVKWVNTALDLGSDHHVIEVSFAIARFRTRKFKVVDWDVFRKVRAERAPTAGTDFEEAVGIEGEALGSPLDDLEDRSRRENLLLFGMPDTLRTCGLSLKD
ncbi:hypothetical protein HPB50_022168 [Hyalomma asiaticum]|uniref:Uncharacterized protein n=1 Tax=Hyalomma asiaticum TaxID=266040 RepID=A0ACB7RWE6_HYAAI|nr:hypothetical protein HPB50_022168 [Hyalomma asiaticum]